MLSGLVFAVVTSFSCVVLKVVLKLLSLGISIGRLSVAVTVVS